MSRGPGTASPMMVSPALCRSRQALGVLLAGDFTSPASLALLTGLVRELPPLPAAALLPPPFPADSPPAPADAPPKGPAPTLPQLAPASARSVAPRIPSIDR